MTALRAATKPNARPGAPITLSYTREPPIDMLQFRQTRLTRQGAGPVGGAISRRAAPSTRRF